MSADVNTLALLSLTFLRREKYRVLLTRNSYSLLLQWLSGSTLDEEWDMGFHSMAGRSKEAVRSVVNSRIQVQGRSDIPGNNKQLFIFARSFGFRHASR